MVSVNIIKWFSTVSESLQWYSLGMNGPLLSFIYAFVFCFFYQVSIVIISTGCKCPATLEIWLASFARALYLLLPTRLSVSAFILNTDKHVNSECTMWLSSSLSMKSTSLSVAYCWSSHLYCIPLLKKMVLSSLFFIEISRTSHFVKFTATGRYEPKSMTRRQTKLRGEFGLLSQQARSKPWDQSLRQTNPTRGRQGIQGPASRQAGLGILYTTYVFSAVMLVAS